MKMASILGGAALRTKYVQNFPGGGRITTIDKTRWNGDIVTKNRYRCNRSDAAYPGEDGGDWNDHDDLFAQHPEMFGAELIHE